MVAPVQNNSATFSRQAVQRALVGRRIFAPHLAQPVTPPDVPDPSPFPPAIVINKQALRRPGLPTGFTLLPPRPHLSPPIITTLTGGHSPFPPAIVINQQSIRRQFPNPFWKLAPRPHFALPIIPFFAKWSVQLSWVSSFSGHASVSSTNPPNAGSGSALVNDIITQAPTTMPAPTLDANNKPTAPWQPN